jgi:hypothetical protein
MGSEIIGPTMGILAHNTHVTYNGIASALASGSVGGLTTNILCGSVFQNFVNHHVDVMIAVGLFLRAICTIKQTPFSFSMNSIFVSL